jgi:hypothetical protein
MAHMVAKSQMAGKHWQLYVVCLLYFTEKNEFMLKISKKYISVPCKEEQSCYYFPRFARHGSESHKVNLTGPTE